MPEISEIINMDVYSEKAILVGKVSDMIIDLDTGSIYGILIKESNPNIVDGGAPISIPYRWVKSVGDAIILRKFPARVRITGINPP
ncbi:MAG: PRC-barrel domain-containing protein [Thermoplasmataceae archaeon]